MRSSAAIIRVGAATATELKEKITRFQNALNSVRAAVEEGVVPGGGVALLRAQRSLDDLDFEDDRRFGVEIIRRAIEEPLRQLARNAGTEPSEVVQEVRCRGPFDGYNARTSEYEDFFLAGILDATKVVRSALQAAASLANLLLSTKTIISRFESPPMLHDRELPIRSPLNIPSMRKPAVIRKRHEVECLFGSSGTTIDLYRQYPLEVVFRAVRTEEEQQHSAVAPERATDVLVALTGIGVHVNPNWHQVQLNPMEDTRPLTFSFTATASGNIDFRLSVYSADNLYLLEEYSLPLTPLG